MAIGLNSSSAAGAGNYASSGSAAMMSETQGGVKFELVGMPECINDENLAASKEQP